jgi:hypothetical protein
MLTLVALNALNRCIYPMSMIQSANAKPPLGTATLLQKRKQIRVHDVEGAVGLALLNDARDVDLAGALRDHLDVNSLLSESAEEAAADAYHAAKLAAYQRNDGHVRNEVDVTPDAEIVDGALKRLVFDVELLFTVTGQQGDFGVQGHGDVNLGRGNEVDTQTMLVQDTEDGHKEAVGTGSLLAVHVKHSDATLDSHSCRTLGRVMLAQIGDRTIAEEACPSAHLTIVGIGVDHSTSVTRIHDVLDPDRDAGTNDLVHSEGMDNLGTVEGQFGSLTRGDRVQEACGRHLAWVGCEDAIDFLPDLKLLGTQTNGSESRTQVGVTTADALEKTSRHSAKVASDDGHSIIAVSVDTVGNRESQVLVELVVQTLCNQLKRDNVAQVNVHCIGATVLQQGGHVKTAELLANRDDHVVGLVRDGFEELGALQDLEQLETLSVDFLGKVLLDQIVGDGILSSLDVVDTNGFDDIPEFLRVGLENISGSAQETVGGAFALGRGATRRADDSSTVLAQACTVSASQ